MNLLLFEMRRSLVELDAGLKGDLSITEPMEAMMHSLSQLQVPKSWDKLAWPSKAGLGSWLLTLLDRQKQLSDWTADLATPKVTWLSGLFNPQAFLTAVMQVTARKNEWPLDKLQTVVDVSKRTIEEVRAAGTSHVHSVYSACRRPLPHSTHPRARLIRLSPLATARTFTGCTWRARGGTLLAA